jgi:hypothetical protein
MSDYGTIQPVSQQMSFLSDRDKYGHEKILILEKEKGRWK